MYSARKLQSLLEWLAAPSRRAETLDREGGKDLVHRIKSNYNCTFFWKKNLLYQKVWKILSRKLFEIPVKNISFPYFFSLQNSKNAIYPPFSCRISAICRRLHSRIALDWNSIVKNLENPAFRSRLSFTLVYTIGDPSYTNVAPLRVTATFAIDKSNNARGERVIGAQRVGWIKSTRDVWWAVAECAVSVGPMFSVARPEEMRH